MTTRYDDDALRFLRVHRLRFSARPGRRGAGHYRITIGRIGRRCPRDRPYRITFDFWAGARAPPALEVLRPSSPARSCERIAKKFREFFTEAQLEELGKIRG